MFRPVQESGSVLAEEPRRVKLAGVLPERIVHEHSPKVGHYYGSLGYDIVVEKDVFPDAGI